MTFGNIINATISKPSKHPAKAEAQNFTLFILIFSFINLRTGIIISQPRIRAENGGARLEKDFGISRSLNLIIKNYFQG